MLTSVIMARILFIVWHKLADGQFLAKSRGQAFSSFTLCAQIDRPKQILNTHGICVVITMNIFIEPRTLNDWTYNISRPIQAKNSR